MKKLLPFIIVIFAVGRVAAQAIPNGGFEDWNTSKNWIDPVGYFTSNAQVITQIPGATANVTQLPPWTAGEGFAVQLQTESANGDTLPAFITNSVDNPYNGVGGIPYSQKPTSIQLWYNYANVVGDSAAMIVVFKDSGKIIGTYLFPITVPETTYPLKSFMFTPALTKTPDTVIFAAASSISILRGKKGFPGSTFAMSEVEFLVNTTVTNPLQLNGTFDPWVGDTAITPQGWSATFPGTMKSTDAFSGAFSLQLQTTLGGGGKNNIQPGFATTGQIIGNGNVIGGYPYALQQDTFEFYYKFTPSVNNADSAGFNLEFKTGGIVSPQGYLLVPSAGYKLVKIVTNLSTAPDSVIVNFYSWSSSFLNSPGPNDIGATLEVDAVQFTSQPLTGIRPVLLDDNTLLIYPNPATMQFTIASAQSAINEVRLTNILGQTVLDKQYATGTAALRENIDVSNLTSGVYFISISSGDKVSTGKILVNR